MVYRINTEAVRARVVAAAHSAKKRVQSTYSTIELSVSEALSSTKETFIASKDKVVASSYSLKEKVTRFASTSVERIQAIFARIMASAPVVGLKKTVRKTSEAVAEAAVPAFRNIKAALTPSEKTRSRLTAARVNIYNAIAGVFQRIKAAFCFRKVA